MKIYWVQYGNLFNINGNLTLHNLSSLCRQAGHVIKIIKYSEISCSLTMIGQPMSNETPIEKAKRLNRQAGIDNTAKWQRKLKEYLTINENGFFMLQNEDEELTQDNLLYASFYFCKPFSYVFHSREAEMKGDQIVADSEYPLFYSGFDDPYYIAKWISIFIVGFVVPHKPQYHVENFDTDEQYQQHQLKTKKEEELKKKWQEEHQITTWLEVEWRAGEAYVTFIDSSREEKSIKLEIIQSKLAKLLLNAK